LKINIKGILLICTLAAPLLGAYFFLQYQKKQVKREVKWKMIEGLEAHQLVTLKFSKEQTLTELNWKHAKEFEYQGEMYDIVERHVVGDSIEFIVWWDYEETQLNKQLQALVSFTWLHHPTPNKTKQAVQQLIKSLFAEQICHNDMGEMVIRKDLYFAYSSGLTYCDIDLPYPPPKCD
jgi:hypothetical protein